MKLEGRIALGLDEFMLRLGHLKVLVSILKRTYGNRARIARHLAEALTQPVAVPPEELSDFGNYLVKKKLCVVLHNDGSQTPPHPKARYAHLRVALDANERVVGILQDQGELKVWFQDVAIASRATRSKVGAVTADTREITNKSGVSHLVDWGVITGIANRRLGLTAAGRALAAIVDELLARKPASGGNPYIIGHERIAFAWLLFMVDGDVLTRLITKVSGLEALTKTDAMALAVELHEEMRVEAGRGGPSATVGAVRAVRDFQKDLGLTSRMAGRSGKLPSTVWHRISSRLESLTDLGLFEKIDAQGVSREFDYYYRPTDALRAAHQAMQTTNSPTEWLDTRLVEALHTGGMSEAIAGGDLSGVLIRALKLCLGPTGVHIDSFAVVAATLASMDGAALSFATARDRLVKAAMKHPEVIRLSRGYSGTRAEFASVIASKVDRANEALFLE